MRDFGWRCGLGLFLLAALTSAAASAPPVIAAHPLVLVEALSAKDPELDAMFSLELAKLRIELAGAADVREVLARQPQKSCLGTDDCLVALANATGAAYALLVTVAPDAPKLVASARLVRADGSVVRELAARSFERNRSLSRVVEVRAALRKLLAELDLPSLPAGLPLPVVEPVPLTPRALPAPDAAPASLTPPPPLAAPARPAPALRLASYVAGGAAVVAAGAGVAVKLSAQSDARELAARLDSEGRMPLDDPRALQLRQSIDSKGGAFRGLLIGAGAALAAGAVMFVLSAPGEPSSRVSVAVAPGGAAVYVGGTLP
jgi:hypothetical protein